MRKIGFVGTYDKTDLILSIAKILSEIGNRILIVDNTLNQRCKYVIPCINPMRAYITEFEDMDIAVGFDSLEKIRQYLGLEDDEELRYDIIMVDTDNYEGIINFNLQTAEKLYFATSFDVYCLKRSLESIKEVEAPLHMTKIFYSRQMLKEEEEYFDYLSLGIKVVWNEEKIYFLLENGDEDAIIENQRLAKIKFKNLSNEYKENIVYLVNDIDSRIGERQVRTIIKNL